MAKRGHDAEVYLDQTAKLSSSSSSIQVRYDAASGVSPIGGRFRSGLFIFRGVDESGFPFVPQRAAAPACARFFLSDGVRAASPFGTFAEPPFLPIAERYSRTGFFFFATRNNYTISRFSLACNKRLIV